MELTTASWLANPSDGVSGHSVCLSVCLSVYVLLLPSCFVVCVVQNGGGPAKYYHAMHRDDSPRTQQGTHTNKTVNDKATKKARQHK